MPICRPPIRKISKYNNSNNINNKKSMSLDFDSSMINLKIRKNDLKEASFIRKYKLEYSGQIMPMCRPPIRQIEKYNNSNNINNNNNMSLGDASSMFNRKIRKNDSKETSFIDNEYNDRTNNHSASDCTDSECSKDDTMERNQSLEYISPLQKVSITMAIIFFSIFLVCAMLVYTPALQNNYNDLYESRRRETIQEFRKLVGNIQLKFKSQKLDTWNVFSSQVEEIINESARVSMIILLGNEINTVTCLAHLLGGISGKALGSDHYLTLNARNIGNDHGEIIDKLKAEIKIKKVVIIEDLLTISSDAIKAFHDLCDKENPLVSKALYIITIVSSGYEGSREDKFVEDRLTAQFSNAIDLDILNPLITRIMDGPIISVLPELSMKVKKTITECLLT